MLNFEEVTAGSEDEISRTWVAALRP